MSATLIISIIAAYFLLLLVHLLDIGKRGGE